MRSLVNCTGRNGPRQRGSFRTSGNPRLSAGADLGVAAGAQNFHHALASVNECQVCKCAAAVVALSQTGLRPLRLAFTISILLSAIAARTFGRPCLAAACASDLHRMRKSPPGLMRASF